MITLDEAIKHCEEVAEELRNVDMGELDALYCGDTECIEARKNDCIECANEHKQLAEWLKELKQLREQKLVLDEIRDEIEEQVLESLSDCGEDWFAAEKVNNCLEIIDKYRAERLCLNNTMFTQNKKQLKNEGGKVDELP